MSDKLPKPPPRFEIDQHLRRAYEEMSREEIPEHLRLLAEKLCEKTLEMTRADK